MRLGPQPRRPEIRVLLSAIIWNNITPVTLLGGEEAGSSAGRFWAYIGDDEHLYNAYELIMIWSRECPAD